MPTNFEPIEPYKVDDTDSVTIGRLRHAAAKGDPRARLTVRGIDQRQRQARELAHQEQDTANSGAVARGRAQFATEQDNKRSKRETGSAPS